MYIYFVFPVMCKFILHTLFVLFYLDYMYVCFRNSLKSNLCIEIKVLFFKLLVLLFFLIVGQPDF